MIPRLIFFLCVMLTGCISHTIVPTDQRPTQASYDGNYRDSGVVSATPAGLLVTERVRERYNAMITSYGKDPAFMPPLLPDQGLTPASPELVAATKRGPLFIMSQQAAVHFSTLNRWRRMGKPPIP